MRRQRGAIALDETFDAIVFDWDGTAVADREADATSVREHIEALTAAGIHVFVVSGTHLENVDGQLGARPAGRGRLFMCCNRGSEVFEVITRGPILVWRRSASAAEDACLDEAAERTAEVLRARGLGTKLISDRLNRRKIDLIPLSKWADPKKADIAALTEAVALRLAAAGIADLREVVGLAREAARVAGVSDPRITSDVKHVEIGLTDKSDSARFAAEFLADRGITGALVLVAGDELGQIGGLAGSDSFMMIDALARATVVSVGVEPGGVPDRVLHLKGGPEQFLALLNEQLTRRLARRVPQVDPDPAWVLPLSADHAKERVAETLGTLGNGFVATRGAREEDRRGATPSLFANGSYTDDSHLVPGPIWTDLELVQAQRGISERRYLDLRTGTLVRLGPEGSALRTMRFVSGAAPHALALRAEARVGDLEAGATLRPAQGAENFTYNEREGVCFARSGPSGGEIAVAGRDHSGTTSGRRVVERLAACVASPSGEASFDAAGELLTAMVDAGFDTLLAEHRESWAARWRDAEVVIEGDSQSELAARFAVFHLLSAAADSGEAAVGARGLTGEAYSGHVFWDADVFVLPALAAIRPEAARAMLEYRIRRLPAARAAAKAEGLAGARFPWESAGDGSDVTPRQVRGRGGEVIPIRSGTHEEHIVADVAWAATRYAAWTGHAAFLDGAGRDLVVETARYWASRIRIDAAGRGHLFGVMGPDEYHEVVDDNAYTNAMARFNLRKGAELLLAKDRESSEAATWQALADGLVEGWNPTRGLYEQFAGYFDLEPLLMDEIASPPVAIDVLLGRERVAGSQLIKQVDVLMAHHLVPDQMIAGSLTPCLAFYEPRTAHGSSLSPAIAASLHARDGKPEQALELFRLAARLDLDDVTGTTTNGLHLATMGGLWQALAYGFLGLEADGQVLRLDPLLPEAWTALGLKFRFRGQHVGVRAEHDVVRISCDAPLLVRLGDRSTELCEPPGVAIAITASGRERSER